MVDIYDSNHTNTESLMSNSLPWSTSHQQQSIAGNHDQNNISPNDQQKSADLLKPISNMTADISHTDHTNKDHQTTNSNQFDSIYH